MVESMIGKGVNVNIKNENGSTPLLMAIANGYENVAELLILNGADVNDLAYRTVGRWKTRPLHLASEQGEGKIWSNQCGRKVFSFNRSFQFVSGQEKVVELLIQKGAEINALDQYTTALHRASEKGIKNVVFQ